MEYAKQDYPNQFSSKPSSVPKRKGELRHTREADVLREEGWAMRSFSRGCSHQIADHRTVGLQENFDHPDIQIFFPMNGQLALGILGTSVELVKSGKRFEDGNISGDVLEGLDVKFVTASVDGVSMLRVILPDKKGRLSQDEIASPYSNQYTEL